MSDFPRLIRRARRYRAEPKARAEAAPVVRVVEQVVMQSRSPMVSASAPSHSGSAQPFAGRGQRLHGFAVGESSQRLGGIAVEEPAAGRRHAAAVVDRVVRARSEAVRPTGEAPRVESSVGISSAQHAVEVSHLVESKRYAVGGGEIGRLGVPMAGSSGHVPRASGGSHARLVAAITDYVGEEMSRHVAGLMRQGIVSR